MVRVNVGCGASPTPGWVNLDASPSVLLGAVPVLPGLLARLRLLGPEQARFAAVARNAGVRWARATRLGLAGGSAEVVYSSHMLEHLPREEAARFLAEARRVLAPGGVLRLAVPDLARLARRYLETGDADGFVAGTLLAAGGRGRALRRAAGLFIGGHHHAWMYDAASLCAAVEAAGFTEARALAPGETRIPDPGPLDLRERADESVYVEAVRP